MKLRTVTTAMLAPIVAIGIASATAPAQGTQLTVAKCESAWAGSDAYPECGDRFEAPGSINESVEVVRGWCEITTSCLYYEYKDREDKLNEDGIPKRRNTSWEGEWEDTGLLKNCEGTLSLSC